ncbi:MAG: hypothetical protein ACP5JH_07295 [Bacteroidota bacterium]
MKNTALRFPRHSFAIIAGILIISVYPAYSLGGVDILVAVLVGGLIAVVNAAAGFLSIIYAFDKSNTTFIKVIVGGMGSRLMALAAIVFVAFKVLALNVVAFTISLFFFYFLSAAAEIIFLNRAAAQRSNKANESVAL